MIHSSLTGANLLQEDEAITLKSFLNENYGVIGRTASTKYEPNTSSKFQFWLSKRPVPNNPAYARKNEEHADTSLQERLGGDARENEVASIEIGNIVAALADLNDDITFGLVVEMRSYSDIDSFIADYLSHDFGDAKIEVPTDISEVVVVTCSVMRNVSARTKPVGRSRIYFPSSLGIEFAYGIVDDRGKILFSGAPIPVGVFENGDGSIAPIRIDEDFILGPQGAHLNVSGISGLASKTSAIQFITKSVLTHKQKRAAVVMFNVKSRDLLYVDQANPTLESENWSQKAYKLNYYTE